MTNNSASIMDGIGDDVGAIRSEMTRLKDQVAELVVGAGKDGAAMARRVQGTASVTVGEVAEASEQMMRTVGKELVAAQKQAVGVARNHPFQSAALLFGLGALVVMLARR